MSAPRKGKLFQNVLPQANEPKGLSAILKWRWTSRRALWPEFVDDNFTPDFETPLTYGQAALTYINHACDVIQFSDLSLITDPVFSQRTSPVKFAGPKRHRAPGATISQLPKLDVVLVSHNHYDHLDRESLLALEAQRHPLFIAPLGNRAYLTRLGLKNVVELDWWQTIEYGKAKVTLVPTQHWSARGISDRYETLWGGFVIEHSGLKIFFAGDSGYCEHFKEIHAKFGPMDLSILPIGAYEPRWFMKWHHMNPADAVQAHRDLQSQFSVATHFGTFQLTDEGIDEPVLELKRALAVAGVAPDKFVERKNGQTIRVLHR
jgi:L-ascorbate metabolism protein UlaG (beta-lactamase superfamily)